MITALSAGPVYTIEQDVVYAMPVRASTVLSDTALEIANDEAFTSPAAVAADTPTKVSGLFVRCTTGDALVNFKAD